MNILKSIHRTILQGFAHRPTDTRITAFVRELFAFGYKEALSCVFPVFIFGMLAVTRMFTIPGLPRYDLLLVACVGMQWLMYRVGLETKREIAVVCFFHLLGVAMEIFKVAHGSWGYPDQGYTKIFGVPLYSGFMYASVASYICQAWRHFDLTLERWPPTWVSVILAVAIYGNFYSNAYIPDLRLVIMPILAIAFARTWVYFETNGVIRRMPMIISFMLIAFFIWLAENIGTFLGAWRYPHQHTGWSVVKLQLLSSWFLLVIVSVIIVVLLKRLEASVDGFGSPDRDAEKRA